MIKLKEFFDATMVKFLIVGCINAAVGGGVMFALYNLVHCSYWFSSVMNYIVGSIVSYFLNKHFTFRSHEKGWKPLLRFTVNIVVCYFIAYAVAKPLAAAFLSDCSKSVQENVAMAVGMCFFTGLNYLGQRFFAFRQKA